MKKLPKLILITLSLLTILSVIILFMVLSLLPGPREIKQSLVEPNELDKNISAKTTNTLTKTQANSEIENKQESLAVTEGVQEKKKQSNNVALLKRLIEEDSYLSVCENLREDSSYKVGPEKTEIDFDSLFDETNDNDPILETFRYPLIQVFKDESLSELMQEVLKPEVVEAKESERSTMLEKMNFYAKAAATVVSLRSRKEEFEQLADRSEHLRVLAMVSQLNPDLSYDSDFLETCSSLQESIMKRDKKVDIFQEREMIVGLIKTSGLTPKDLNFNPKKFTKYEVKLSQEGLTFSLDSEGEDSE